MSSKYHTEPFILDLRRELKSLTGVSPKTPEKHDNPFESGDLPELMAKAWISTTLFDERSGSSGASFRWGIDHMATLHPVEISRYDIVRTEYLKHVQTESDEDHAQDSIRSFFDGVDVHQPSPLTNHSTSDQHSTRNFRRTKTKTSDATRNESGQDTSNLACEHPRTDILTRDVQSQTDITINPDVNFEYFFDYYQSKIHFRYRGNSLGTVKRKLFTEGEEVN